MISISDINEMTRAELEDAILDLYSKDRLEFPDSQNMLLMQARLSSWIDTEREG